MQTLVVLSTTEAEVIALSTAMQEVITLMNLVEEMIGRGFPIPASKPQIKCRVFEDNAAAIKIAKNPKMHPRTKHLGRCIMHFRQYVLNSKVMIEYINTHDQLADVLTKPLARDQFNNLVSKIMGW